MSTNKLILTNDKQLLTINVMTYESLTNEYQYSTNTIHNNQ